MQSVNKKNFKKNFKTLANKLVRDEKAKFVESAVRSGHKALVLV